MIGQTCWLCIVRVV